MIKLTAQAIAEIEAAIHEQRYAKVIGPRHVHVKRAFGTVRLDLNGGIATFTLRARDGVRPWMAVINREYEYFDTEAEAAAASDAYYRSIGFILIDEEEST